MARYSNKWRGFYVVQFIELPFKDIDDYVCVPYTWMTYRKTAQKALVAYPHEEDPSVTRERVKRKEKYKASWQFYMVFVKYKSDTYTGAVQWIAKINNFGSLVEKDSTITDTQPKFTLKKRLHIVKRNHSSKFNNNRQQPLRLIKRRSKPKTQLDEKQLKLNDAGQSSRAVVTDSKTESKSERLIVIQDNQSMECAQTDEAAAASIVNESTEQMNQTQCIEQNKQALSLPVIDVDELPELLIDEENHSQGIKKNDKNNSQSNLVSNKTAASMTAEEPLTSAEQTTQPNQYKNQEHILDSRSSLWNFQPRIENVQSLSNNTQTPVENKIHPMNNKKDLAVAAQKPSNLIDHTASLSPRSVEEQLLVVSQNHSQNGLLVRETHTGNSKEQIGPLGSIAVSFEKTQHKPKINTKPHDMTFVDPRNVFLYTSNMATQGKHNKYDHRPNSQTIRMRIPSTGQNSTNPSNSLYLTSELPEQRQSQPNQQDLQRQPQISKGEQLYASNIATQGKNLMAFHQNPYQPTCQTSFQQDLLKESKDINKHCHRPNSPTIRMRIPSTGQNSTNPSNPLYLTSELPEQRQSQPNQQDLQRQPQISKGEQLYASNIATQGKNLMAFHQNPYQPTCQTSFQQDLLKESKDINKHCHRPNSPTIRMRIPSTGQNSTNPSNPLYLTSELPEQRQSQPNQQDLQRQPQIPKGEQLYASNIATQGKHLMAFHQNPYQPTYQTSFQQNLLKESKDINKHYHRPNPPTIRMRIPSTGQNSTNPSNPLYLTSGLPEQRQSQPNQQDLQRQPQISKGEQLYASNIATQGKNLMAFHQNPYQPTYQTSFQQDLLKESKDINKHYHRPNPPTIRMRIPSTGQNSTNPSNPLYLTSGLPEQRQSQPNQQDLQRQPQISKGEQLYASNIATQGKNLMAFHQNPYQPTCQTSFQQDLLKESKDINKHCHRPNSPTIRVRIPSTGQNSTNPSNPLCPTSELPQQKQSQPNQQDLRRQPQILKGEQQLQALQKYLNVMNNVRQIDELMEEGRRVNSTSDAVTDHKVISDHEMSTDDEPIETTNNNGIASGGTRVDRPIAAQNSTFPNRQTHARVVLEQQMLDNFATLFTQMGCTLRYTYDMCNHLQSSIRETAVLYKQLLGAVEDFNSKQIAGNLIGNASPVTNLTPKVSQSPVEKHIQVSPRANSSNDNQHSNDVALALPPEYDPNDTKWTLKYRTHMPGLSELMPRSRIYVNHEDLVYCQRVSNDCKSLARRLLPLVFKKSALSVCLLITEETKASDNVGFNLKPELDANASIVLLNFVREHGMQRGWKIDLQPILDSIHSKIQKFRFKYGKRDQC